MVVSIEQHVDWVIGAASTTCARERLDVIEPTPVAEAGWVQHVNDCADITLFPRANSWYMGANVPGKPRVFLPYVGGVDRYRKACDEVVSRDYLGFAFDGPGGARCNDGVVNRLQLDVAMLLELIAELGLPPLETLSVEDARARCPWPWQPSGRPAPTVGEVVDGVLPGAAGPLAYRRYRPASPGPHPIVVYFHGGGWVLGGLDSDDPVLPRPLRAVRRDRRVGRLPPCARGAVPRGGRRRVRRRPLDRGQRRGPRRRAGQARGVRLERRRQHRRRRLPDGARCRRARGSPARCW